MTELAVQQDNARPGIRERRLGETRLRPLVARGGSQSPGKYICPVTSLLADNNASVKSTAGWLRQGRRVAHCASCCDQRNSLPRMHIMTANDICTDIAALLNPLPSLDEARGDFDDGGFGPPVEPTLQKRDELAESLRLAWSE